MVQLSKHEAERISQIVTTSPGAQRSRSQIAELEKRVGKHDEGIDAILDAIRQLMAPPEKPRREIGFHVRETAPRYQTRKS